MGYSTYNIKNVNKSLSIDDSSTKHSFRKKIVGYSTDLFIETKRKKKESFFYKKNNNKKRVILVDDDKEILFTYRLFLEGYDYNITSFTDPLLALNYIRDISDFNNLLVILDIRMENLNGFQLHQQIKAIDPTIKIIFVTVLDILDEILTIVPGISKEHIMRKPVDEKEFTNTVNRLFN
jgi:FixJ family two-component response regulator